MKHIVITRAKFSSDDKFQKYFDVMKKYFIPSINSQTNKNFILGLTINPIHFPKVRELIDNKIEIIPFSDVKTDFKDYVINNQINLQTRHDCDDFMKENYIEFLQNRSESQRMSLNDFIITFQPSKLDFQTGREYKHERDYSKVCSMFSTLFQKNVSRGIMDEMHDHLTRITRNVIYINEPYVKLVIHSNNLHSKLHQSNIQIK